MGVHLTITATLLCKVRGRDGRLPSTTSLVPPHHGRQRRMVSDEVHVQKCTDARGDGFSSVTYAIDGVTARLPQTCRQTRNQEISCQAQSACMDAESQSQEKSAMTA